MILEGTPVGLSEATVKLSVAAAPKELFSVNPFPVNFVPAELVLNVMVAAPAVPTIRVVAIPMRDSN